MAFVLDTFAWERMELDSRMLSVCKSAQDFTMALKRLREAAKEPCSRECDGCDERRQCLIIQFALI